MALRVLFCGIAGSAMYMGVTRLMSETGPSGIIHFVNGLALFAFASGLIKDHHLRK